LSIQLNYLSENLMYSMVEEVQLEDAPASGKETRDALHQALDSRKLSRDP